MKTKISFLFSIIVIIFFSISLSGCNESIKTEENLIKIEGKNQEFHTITEALNSSEQGDIILVPEGIYNETLLINKTVTIKGQDKNNTIISGNKTGDVIQITVDFVNISGFTITNGGPISIDNVDAAIDIRSNFNNISHCNISSNENYGVYLHTMTKNNTIEFNTISNNTYGIYSNNGNKNNISSNIISSNSEYGIYLGSLSNDNLILSNMISENNYGLRIKGSRDNILIGNDIVNNFNGLYFCCGANDNLVYSNYFINNTNWHINDYLSNTFDNGSLGNYWDDYNGTDINNDGIGDTPYIISSGKNQDNYPILDINRKYKI